ncbi:MAG TPA: hypothetical protein VHC20_08065, partial [Candidatus Paceibacterota bacterium]|nr:hypothetical protein [Candidatus Paceibacterota bacterium]
PYRSQIRQALASGRSEELERLAIEMYARGLSVRDIERTFTDRRGECLLSKMVAQVETVSTQADRQADRQTGRIGERPLVFNPESGLYLPSRGTEIGEQVSDAERCPESSAGTDRSRTGA